jgi:hypothetical protein
MGEGYVYGAMSSEAVWVRLSCKGFSHLSGGVFVMVAKHVVAVSEQS